MQTRWMAVLVGAILLNLGHVAHAQESTKFEIFGGYQITNLEAFGSEHHTFHGWTAAFQTNLPRSFSLVAEVSGGYRHEQIIRAGTGVAPIEQAADHYVFLFGPRYTLRKSKGSIFVHALFGDTHGTQTLTQNLGPQQCIPEADCPPITVRTEVSESDFAAAFGGGADLSLGRKFAVRIAQLDYLYSHHEDARNHFRYSTGIVFRFGKR